RVRARAARGGGGGAGEAGRRPRARGGRILWVRRRGVEGPHPLGEPSRHREPDGHRLAVEPEAVVSERLQGVTHGVAIVQHHAHAALLTLVLLDDARLLLTARGDPPPGEGEPTPKEALDFPLPPA